MGSKQYIPKNPRRPAWSYKGRGGKDLGVREPVTDEDWLRRILADHFGADESALGEGSVLAEILEFDELDFLELGIRCEEHFEFEFGEDDAVEELRTFGDWLRVIQQMSQRKSKGNSGVLPVGGRDF